jgi:hypothetical protein
MAQVQRLFSSAGLVLFQMVFGTTPNMAPPSNLKKPVSMVCSFIDKSKLKSQNSKGDKQIYFMQIFKMEKYKLLSSKKPVAFNSDRLLTFYFF